MNKSSVTQNELNTKLSKVEKIELIYNRFSQDPDLNWYETGGLTSAVTFIKDFSKYKKLIAYIDNYPNGGSFIIDIASVLKGDITRPIGTVYSMQNDQGYLYVYKVILRNRGNNSWGFEFSRNRQNDNNFDAGGNIYRLEGVLA